MDMSLLSGLRKRIDDALLAVDGELCEYARHSGVARDAVRVVGLSTDELAAIVNAFLRDSRLWTEFRRQLSQTPEVRFDDLFHASCQASPRPAPRPGSQRPDDSDYRDGEGWARRVNTLAGKPAVDAVTLYAVAYAVGRDGGLRKAFHALIMSAQNEGL